MMGKTLTYKLFIYICIQYNTFTKKLKPSN